MNQPTHGGQVRHNAARVCTVLSVCAGAVSLVGFLMSSVTWGGSALAAAVLCLAAASWTDRQASRAADERAAASANVLADQLELLRAECTAMMQKLEQVGAAQRRLVKVSVAQGDRVEEQNAAMSRRILSDLNRLRLEVSDGVGSSLSDGSAG